MSVHFFCRLQKHFFDIKKQNRTKKKKKQLLPLSEGNMSIYLPSTGNIAPGQCFLPQLNIPSCYRHTRAIIV